MVNPDQPTETEVRASQRKRRIILLAVGLVVLLLGLIPAKHFANQRRDKAAVQQALDRIRAAGQPVTGRELLARRPNLPPERNWRLAVEPLLTNRLQIVAWELLRSNAPAEVALAALGSDCASNAPAVAMLLRTDLTDMGWRESGPADPDNVFSYQVPSIFQNMVLTKALGEQAAYEVAAGRPDQATTALVKSFAVAHVGNPGFIGFVGDSACELFALQALEMALNRGVFADADLLRLARALPRRATNALQAAVVAERVGAIWACEFARDHPIQYRYSQFNAPITGPAPRGLIGQIWAAGQQLVAVGRQVIYRPGDFLALLDRHARREEASLLPLRERLSSFERADIEMNALDRRTTCGAVLRIEVRGFKSLAKEDAVNQVRLGLAHTALAVERWRLAHEGRLPENLAELVPTYLTAVPADPFDDQSIRFKHLPQGFVVYSVGLDGTDNSGKEDPAYGTGDNGYDLTFTIKR